MSLINEALKKAQRARNDGQPTDAPPMPGGGLIAKRAQPRSAKSMVLIGGGALALVVVSVVATVYLLNRTPTPVSVAATTGSSPASPTASAPNSAAPVSP